MKRQVTISALIILLWVVLPGLPALAKPTRIPHENPATTAESLEIVPLILSYNRVIELASERQYGDAQDILDEVRHADIPEGIQHVVDRYSSLYQRLLDTIEKLEPLPDMVMALLDSGKVQEAKQVLTNSASDIRDAETLARDIEAVTATMSQEIGIYTGPVANLTQQARAQLESNLEQLNKLLDNFHSLQNRLFERYVQKAGLTTTELSLNITPNSAFVGDTVTVYGWLTGGGSPLPGREITLATGGKPIITDDNGSYKTDLTIPYIYKDRMDIIAAYKPSDNDDDIYLASESPLVTVNTRFYRTMIELSAPDNIQSGKPFTISGQVRPTNDAIIRKVSIFLNDTLIAEAKATERFSLEITLPERAQWSPTEIHTLTVAVTPQGRYSGAIEKRSLNTSTWPVYIDIQAPKIAFLPHTARISGRIYDDAGPVTDAPVTIYLGDRAITTRTAGDGSFAISVGIPLDLFLIAGRPLSVNAKPTEPWYASAHSEQRLYTVNLIVLEMMAFIFLAVWIFANPGSRTRQQETTVESTPEVTELTAINPTPSPKTRPTGIKGRIISAYRDGLEAVAKVTGTGLAPNVTLREFLATATLLVPTANGRFAELTNLTEAALYSEQNLPEATATRAEQLASDINEELQRGTA